MERLKNIKPETNVLLEKYVGALKNTRKYLDHLEERHRFYIGNNSELEEGVKEFAPKLRQLEQDIISEGKTRYDFWLLGEEGFGNYEDLLLGSDLNHDTSFIKVGVSKDTAKFYEDVVGEWSTLAFSGVSIGLSMGACIETYFPNFLWDYGGYLVGTLFFLGTSLHFYGDRDKGFENYLSHCADYLEETLEFRKNYVIEIGNQLDSHGVA